MGNILEGPSRELKNSLINSVGQCFIEMLTVVHLVMKFFASYGTEGFVTLLIPVPILIYKSPSYFIRNYF